jgi:ferredoxin--NADP+ reductase
MSDAIRHLEEFDRGPHYAATVVSSERITPEASEVEVRELVLDVDRPGQPFRLGQSIGIVAPGNPAFGQEHHFRLYSIADLPEEGGSGRPRIKICVRRCNYIDEYSGERFKGLASNYLCDLHPGDTLTLTGPFPHPFDVPVELDANLILIGSGTGIAPFRGLVKHIYRDLPEWKGRIWLFHGARTGLEMLYRNDERDDFAQYYDHETFEAFQALSPRPGWSDAIAWDRAIEERSAELWNMLGGPKTYVYVAGPEETLTELEKVFADLAGGLELWQRRKAELVAGRRWVELVY